MRVSDRFKATVLGTALVFGSSIANAAQPNAASVNAADRAEQLIRTLGSHDAAMRIAMNAPKAEKDLEAYIDQLSNGTETLPTGGR